MLLELKNISKYYGDKKILEIENLKIYEKEKSIKKDNENDKLLIDFKLSQISSELSITKDEKRKIELEKEYDELIKLKRKR